MTDDFKKDLKDNFKSMSLGDHLEELRFRIILMLAGIVLGLVVSLIFGKYIVDVLRVPYDNLELGTDLLVLSPAQGFTSYMKVCLMVAVIISCPWLIYQMWKFVSHGLYSHEKKFVYIFVPMCSALFIVGCAFCFFAVVPVTLKFFDSFNRNFLNATSAFTFQEYIGYLTNMTLVFGVAFQCPVAILIANKASLVSIAKLKAWRKYVFLLAFIIAAIATPPDPISQIMLALPIYVLYEFGILLCLIL